MDLLRDALPGPRLRKPHGGSGRKRPCALEIFRFVCMDDIGFAGKGLKIQGDRSRHDFFTILGINRPAVIVSDIEGVRSGQKPPIPCHHFGKFLSRNSLRPRHPQISLPSIGDLSVAVCFFSAASLFPHPARPVRPYFTRSTMRAENKTYDCDGSQTLSCVSLNLLTKIIPVCLQILEMGSTCNRLLSTFEEPKWYKFLPCPWKRGNSASTVKSLGFKPESTDAL